MQTFPGCTLTLVSSDAATERAPAVQLRDATADDAALARIATRIANLEHDLAVARSERDDEIQRQVQRGRSERACARSANVSPGYAHRAAKHGRFARVTRS